MSDSGLIRTHNIKAPDAKEDAILNMLRVPGTQQKVQAIAATLASVFSATTKLLVDVRPGATFKDSQTNTVYVYEGTLAPFDYDALTTLILREARQPLEEMEDQGYAYFRVGTSGNRYVTPLKDFIKMVSIEKWVLLDANIADENELTRKMF